MIGICGVSVRILRGEGRRARKASTIVCGITFWSSIFTVSRL